MVHAPKFWTTKNCLSISLLPLSWVYSFLSTLRTIFTKPYTATVPVICVGNLTVGGTGKTPVCIDIANQIKNKGYKNVIIVSKGYGGKITTPTVVDSHIHSVHDVGDEPYLLAQYHTVIIGKNRRSAVKFAEHHNADIIIMDDGLQNPHIKKNKTIVVVDGYRGFQNGFILPAGPMRQSVKNIHKADAVIITGQKIDINTAPAKTYFTPYIPSMPNFKERQSVVAFTGIANPDKFFKTIQELGYPMRAKVSYPDHHFYNQKDIDALDDIANKALAKLVTTEKDYVRLSHAQRKNITPIYITTHIKPNTLVDTLLKDYKLYER